MQCAGRGFNYLRVHQILLYSWGCGEILSPDFCLTSFQICGTLKVEMRKLMERRNFLTAVTTGAALLLPNKLKQMLSPDEKPVAPIFPRPSLHNWDGEPLVGAVI